MARRKLSRDNRGTTVPESKLFMFVAVIVIYRHK
jgi:hypothetical protein